MRFLSFVYRFITNFAFLVMVYLSLNYIEKYNNRAILAIAILAAIALRLDHQDTVARDALIAGSALVHRMSVVTRDVKDFQRFPELAVVNPWA